MEHTEYMKRRKSIRNIRDGTDQMSLVKFFEENKEKELTTEVSKEEIKKGSEIIVEDKTIEKRESYQIETDYRDKNTIDTYAKRIKERFNVGIEILPVMYGSKPPINQKIYGYYMLINVKDRYREMISKFIEEDCKIKVY